MPFKSLRLKYRNDVENRLRSMSLDKGGKYYCKYIRDGQVPGLFTKFLQGQGIVAQIHYTWFN